MPQPPMLQQQIPLPSAPAKHSRCNLADLKWQIVKRLGQDRAQLYFSYLNGLLLQKLSKREFTKRCLLTLGRENLPLHNQFIRLILQNACQAKAPPQFEHDQTSTGIVMKKSPQVDDGLGFTQASRSVPQSCSDDDILKQLPHRFRSEIDSCEIQGSDGRVKAAACQPAILSYDVVLDEKDDLKRSRQQQWRGHQKHLSKRARIEKASLHNKVSPDSKIFADVVPLDHNLDNMADMNSFRSPLQAPLGIPFCLAGSARAKRSLLPSCSASSTSFCTCYDCSELYSTEVLKIRIEKIADAQGLEGVTVDCANLLNNSLDSYLKRLIMSYFQLIGARTSPVLVNQPIANPLHHTKSNSGVWRGNDFKVPSRIGPMEGTHVMSIQDFKVAMELNPLQLGEDWPLLLEKICIRAFEK